MPDFAHERRYSGLVAGVDEAGRGPLAGPVAAAAVILMPALVPRSLLRRIDDSKQLTAETRQSIAAELRRRQTTKGGVIAAVACASTVEIERLNILQATFLAMRRAVARLPVRPAHVLVDGNLVPRDLGCPADAIVDGDALSLSIAAASILAKVARDRVMERLGRRHPGYGWERNAGYGTPEHRAAIERLGPNRHHRLGFAPFRTQRLDVNSADFGASD